MTARAIATRVAIACLALFIAANTVAATSAIFSTATVNGGSVAQTDAIENFLDLTPGTAVQDGTATPVATGSNATLAIDLGRVPDSHTFNDALRLHNVDVWPHTVSVADLGLASVLAIEFSDGTTTKTIPPGVTEQLRIRTTTAFAGQESGEFRLEDSVDSFFYSRNLPFQTTQAPEAVTNLVATPSTTPSPQVDLAWDASTSSGVAGYNVYRSSAAAGPYTKLNGAPQVATNYLDTTVAAAGSYYYRVMAVAAGVAPELESLYAQVSAQLIPTPTAVSVPAGASNPVDYINSLTVNNATIRVSVPAATLAGDVVYVSAASGATTVTASQVAAGGAQTLDIGAIDLAPLAQGPVSLSAWITRGSDSGVPLAGGATKDTLAEVSGSRIAATVLNPVNFINTATGVAPGTAMAGIDLPSSSTASDTVTIRLSQGGFSTTGTASGLAGTGTLNIAGLSTDGWADGTVFVAARVIDLAGNDSGWTLGTDAVRDTVAPAIPTGASIAAAMLNPVDYVNSYTVAAATVTVISAAAATDTIEARLTSSGVTASGAATAAGSPTNVVVDATGLADTALGGLAIEARVLDAAGNASAWFVGTAGTKDTVATAPNWSLISFRNMIPQPDRVQFSNGAIDAYGNVRIIDYVNNITYPASGWLTASANGGIAGWTPISTGGLPRTLGYEFRDPAWNLTGRICRSYSANGTGAAAACP